MGKKPYRGGSKGIDWDAQPLGKIPNKELARNLGVSPSIVRKELRRRGIPTLVLPPVVRPPKPKKPSFKEIRKQFWDSQPLGLVSDREIADRTGHTPGLVSFQRIRRGIPKFDKYAAIDWDSQPLGNRSDAKIAKDLGVNINAVSSARRKKGLKGLTPGRPPKEKRIRWDKVPFGTRPDGEIALELGVHVSSVCSERVKRGIPRFRLRTICPCGKPTVNNTMWCTPGKKYLDNSCAYKVQRVRLWCGINKTRGGTWESRNHELDKLFLALFTLVQNIRNRLGVKKIPI